MFFQKSSSLAMFGREVKLGGCLNAALCFSSAALSWLSQQTFKWWPHLSSQGQEKPQREEEISWEILECSGSTGVVQEKPFSCFQRMWLESGLMKFLYIPLWDLSTAAVNVVVNKTKNCYLGRMQRGKFFVSTFRISLLNQDFIFLKRRKKKWTVTKWQQHI